MHLHPPIFLPIMSPRMAGPALGRAVLTAGLLLTAFVSGCESETTTPGGDTAVGTDAEAGSDLGSGTDALPGSDTAVPCDKFVPSEVEALIVAECGGCHDKPNGVFKASSCKSTAARRSKIKSEVKANSMPPGGGLSAAEKAQIIQWVDDGGLCTACP